MDTAQISQQSAGVSDQAVPGGGSIRETLARLLSDSVDLGLLATLLIAPLFMGGRGEIGRLVYVCIVCVTAICWAARQSLTPGSRWRWSGMEMVLLGGALLVSLQLTSLPSSLLARISPGLGELLPLWSSHGSGEQPLGVWQTTTLTPQATRAGFVTLIAHGMLFWVVVQRIGDRTDLERLVRWVVLAAIFMAVLGLAQFVFGNGKFLWCYEHPSRTTDDAVKGTFQNQNHFAHFLALGIGPLIWWLHRIWSIGETSDNRSSSKTKGRARRTGTRSPSRSGRVSDRGWAGRAGLRTANWQVLKPFALATGLVLIILAELLTLSRGGIMAMSLAMAVCFIVLYRRRLIGRRTAVAVAGMAALLTAAVALHGCESLVSRLDTLRNARSFAELSYGRAALWSAHLRAIPHFGLVGAGVGSHPEIYRTYMREDVALDFTHGESGYLQLLLETGFLGLALGLAAVGFVGFWCLRAVRAAGRPSDTVLAGGLLAGFVVSVVHSLVDFVWYIPACMSMTIILAACACRLFQVTNASQASRGRSRPFRCLFGEAADLRFASGVWPIVTLGCVVSAWAMIADRVPPARAAMAWDAYFKLSLAERGAWGVREDDTFHRDAQKIRRLADVLQRDPRHARANLRLATLLLRRFDARQQASDMPMALAQIRDAALASKFPTPDAQDHWLQLVMGDNRKLLDSALQYSRRAVQLCPLQGEGYMYLAELEFLQWGSRKSKQAYIAQALQVRPYSGVVLLAAGAEAALAGDERVALDLYQRAFHQASEQRAQVIALIGPHISADDFLRELRPDADALERLYAYYRRQGRLDDARTVGPPLIRCLRRTAARDVGSSAAERWERAGEIHEFLGNTQDAVECLRNALHHDPNDYGRRERLAGLLLADGELDAAISELKWCLTREPRDEGLRRDLESASRRRLVEQDTNGLF